MAALPTGEPSWKWRRLFLAVVLVYAGAVLVDLEDAADTRVNDTVASGMVFLMVALTLGYMGFATIQDIAAVLTTKSGLPYRPPSPSEEDEPK